MRDSTVAIVKNKDIKKGITEVLELLTGLDGLFTNKHVAIKPNDTWASPTDKTACTQADTVQAVIPYVKSFNPSKITVTGGAGAGETDQIFHILGIDQVIAEEQVAFFDHNRPPFQAVELDWPPQNTVMVNPHLFTYDTIISLAQHKVHHLAGVTLSMKNIALSFPAADYYGHPRADYKHEHHFFKDVHKFIAAMCTKFPFNLGIIAGHPAMIEQGPIGGKVFESELILAGQDFVALDTVGAWLLGQEQVKHIELAAEAGLGTSKLQEIPIRGLSLEEARQHFQAQARQAG